MDVKLYILNFDPNSASFAKILANRYAERNLERQKQLSELVNTNENRMKASRYPLASFTTAVNELSIDAKITAHLVDNGVQEDEFPDFSNVIKLQQAREMLQASLEEIQAATKADVDRCKAIETYLAEMHQ